MANYSTNEFRSGLKLMIDGNPYSIIENEFVIMDNTIKLWCLIEPTRDSFENLLKGIDCRDDPHWGFDS